MPLAVSENCGHFDPRETAGPLFRAFFFSLFLPLSFFFFIFFFFVPARGLMRFANSRLGHRGIVGPGRPAGRMNK